MTTYRCGCPYGCGRIADDGEICENCRLGWHGRFCDAFLRREPEQRTTDVCCRVCGGLEFDHPAWWAQHPGAAEREERYRRAPHAPNGIVLPFCLAHDGGTSARTSGSSLLNPPDSPAD